MSRLKISGMTDVREGFDDAREGEAVGGEGGMGEEDEEELGGIEWERVGRKGGNCGVPCEEIGRGRRRLEGGESEGGRRAFGVEGDEGGEGGGRRREKVGCEE